MTEEVGFLVKLRDGAEFLEAKSPLKNSEHPNVDLAQANALPWKPYLKQPQGAWIFTDGRGPAGSERLIEAVKSAGGKFEIGEWSFALSKDGTKPFLSRWPAAKKK